MLGLIKDAGVGVANWESCCCVPSGTGCSDEPITSDNEFNSCPALDMWRKDCCGGAASEAADGVSNVVFHWLG